MEEFIVDALQGVNMFTALYDSIKDILTITNEQLVTATKIYNALLPLGYTLVLLYFLLELLEKTTHDQFNLEVFVKMFIKLVFAETIMDYGDELIGGFISIGNWFILEVKTINGQVTFNPPTYTEQQIKDAVEKLGFIDQIAAWSTCMVIWLITAVTRVTVKVQCWAIKLELILRAALSPIAIADMFSDINRSTGWRYLKKILGVAMQGGALLAIYSIGSVFQTTELVEYVSGDGKINFDAFIDTFIITFSLIGVTATSKQVINDALGN